MSLVKRQKTDSSRQLVASSTAPRTLYSSAVILEGHQGYVLSASFSWSGKHIISGGIDKTIRLWKTPTLSTEETPNYGVLTGHKAAVTSAKWLSDDVTIASSSADSTVGFWDGETGVRTLKCTGHELTVNEVNVASSGTVLSVGDDGTARLWDSRQKSPLSVLSTAYPLLTGTFNSTGGVFYVSGIDPAVLAYDVRLLEKPLWVCGGQNDTVTSVAVSKDDSILVSRSLKGTVRTYSAKDHIPAGIPRLNPLVYDGAPSGRENQLIRAVFTSDNVSIVSGSEDATVTVWDYTTRRVRNKYPGHEGTVLDVDCHPEERVVLLSSTDGKVIVREM